MNKMSALIKLENVTKKYGDKKVLNNINISISEGEYVSIVGASGTGKSTLLNIIGTLDKNFEGDYWYKDKKLCKSELDSFRNRHIGYIFQQYNLLPELTCYENVLLPYVYYEGTRKNIGQRVKALFQEFGLEEQIDQEVSTLSGGEKQRIALIRSIVLNPDIILADEPTGNLDKKNSNSVQCLLEKLNGDGKTVIVVTHDEEFADKASLKLCVENGGIYEN